MCIKKGWELLPNAGDADSTVGCTSQDGSSISTVVFAFFYVSCGVVLSLFTIVWSVRSIKDLKATNEWQDDGAGILHEMAQFPIDQVYLYTRLPCPSPST